MTKMTQTQAVIQVMQQKGGYAKLADLYKEVPLVQDVKWSTKTPDATIRRIVQNEKHFFKIKAGIWALNECKENLPDDIKVLIQTH